MLITSNVPKEIVDALESSTFSFLIKGSAGTGKTTMALEIIRLMNGSAVYLSTRISPNKFYNQFPWSEPCIHQENILDVNTSLDNQTKEETLFEYVDRPSFIRNLYSRILEARGDHSAIIVDSIDALKSNLRIPMDDLNTERDILDMAERVNANVIFISELTEEGKLDYLVDGVVRLEKEIRNERLLRKLYVEKVRSTRIENPMYLFTLKDGRFRCFETGFPINFVQKEFPKYEKTGIKIPTLIPELDKILGGGFEKSTFNIFDVGDKVGISHLYFAVPIFLNYVVQRYPVFSLPSTSIFSTDVIETGYTTSLSERFLSSLDSDTYKYVKKYFYLLLPSTQKGIDKFLSFNVHCLKGENFKEDLDNFIELAIKVMKEFQSETLFITLATDTMEYIYGTEDIIKIIQLWINKIKQLNGIMATFQFGHETFKLPNHLATSYFKLENIGGNIAFYGEIPKTKIYIPGLDVSKGQIQISFTPIE